jgi:hypothetical protein
MPANTSSGKPQAPADKPVNQAAKLSRDSRGLQFRIGEQQAQKVKPKTLRV